MPPARSVPVDRAWADRDHFDVCDMLRRFLRLEIGIEQIFGPGEDQRLRLDRGQGLSVSPSKPGVVPTSCRS